MMPVTSEDSTNYFLEKCSAETERVIDWKVRDPFIFSFPLYNLPLFSFIFPCIRIILLLDLTSMSYNPEGDKNNDLLYYQSSQAVQKQNIYLFEKKLQNFIFIN